MLQISPTISETQCAKSVQIRSFFCSIFSRIQLKCGKIQTRKNFVFAHFSRIVNDNFEREPEEHLKLNQTYVTEVFVKIIHIENFLQKVRRCFTGP